MKSNIALIGFMGTGKTSVGLLLSEKLGKKYVEMDTLIEEKAGKTIPEIFSQDGEIRFRELEMAVAKDLTLITNSIISTGGGIVLNKLNIDYLKKNSFIVLLEADPKEILGRIIEEGKEKRPLLNSDDPLKEINKLLKFRTYYYENSADFIISTDKKQISEITDEIISNFTQIA